MTLQDGRLTLDRLVACLGEDAVVRIPGCGHSVHREAFGTFIAAIDRWLQSSRKGPS